MKHKNDSNDAAQPTVDMRSLLSRIARLEVEIGTIRHELVQSLGGPKVAFDGDNILEDTTTPPGFIALEILDGSGLVLDTATPQQENVVVKNRTGQEVKLSQGPTGIGVVALSIPDGEARGIKRSGNAILKTEFVEYTYYQPDCLPGVLCFLQTYRSVLGRAADGGVGNSEDATTNIITLTRKPTGGFGLTT